MSTRGTTDVSRSYFGIERTSRARGAYRMLATLGEAGLGAAHVNAGFILERLGRGNPDLLKRAKWHYEQTLAGRETITEIAPRRPHSSRGGAATGDGAGGTLAARAEHAAQRSALFAAAKRGSGTGGARPCPPCTAGVPAVG